MPHLAALDGPVQNAGHLGPQLLHQHWVQLCLREGGIEGQHQHPTPHTIAGIADLGLVVAHHHQREGWAELHLLLGVGSTSDNHVIPCHGLYQVLIHARALWQLVGDHEACIHQLGQGRVRTGIAVAVEQQDVTADLPTELSQQLLNDRHEGTLAVAAAPVEEEQELFVGAAGDPVAHTTLQEGGILGIVTGDLADELLPSRADSGWVIGHRAMVGHHECPSRCQQATRLQVDDTVRRAQQHRIGVQLVQSCRHHRLGQLQHVLNACPVKAA